MHNSAEVLFKLIRIALGNEKDFSLPNVVNWEEVFDLAVKQGVDALVWSDILSERCEELGIDDVLKYKWIGHQAIVEKDNFHRFSEYTASDSEGIVVFCFIPQSMSPEKL